MITIIDYGMGNIGSIVNMLKKVGAESRVISNKNDMSAAKKIILPGVGAFDRGMQNLADLGFINTICDAAHKGVPILGICLGMQLLGNKSEEGELSGLGLINAEAIRFRPASTEVKVPHMGWNRVKICKKNEIADKLPEETRFYFVHAYAIRCVEAEDVLMTTYYDHEFVSAFSKNNVYGVQFHPEKSHKFGMQIFDNFSRLTC